MKGSPIVVASVALAMSLAACTQRPPAQEDNKTSVATGGGKSVAFKDATLIVEINATDGDAGLQVFLDHEPWKSIAVSGPDGAKILDIRTRDVLTDYGLTELFSESSEPPFTKFPLEEFKKLFPEGKYTFVGETIDGTRMRSTVSLNHDFPAGPEIVSPEEDSTVPADEVVVRWESVTKPSGIKIDGYKVVVTREDPLRVFSADLPATATELSVPAEFIESGTEYAVEVAAVEASGHQTLTEIAFTSE